jgi:hypothetical protein
MTFSIQCGNGCYDSTWDMRESPEDLVVIEFHCLDAGPQAPDSSLPDTPFPLSLATFKESIDHPAHAAPQPRLFKPVRAQGEEHFAAFVWLGHGVTSSEKAAASRIVSSITEPTKGCP